MGWVGIERDYPVSIKEVLDICAECGAIISQERIRKLKPYRSRHGVTDKDAHWAEMVLNVIQNVETPMLMYQAEKDVVEKSLRMLFDDWELRNIDKPTFNSSKDMPVPPVNWCGEEPVSFF